MKCNKIFTASLLDTQLGRMVAIADKRALYLLEFVDRGGLERQLERFSIKREAAIVPGITDPIHSIALELGSYFEGKLKQFRTALHLLGTPFQMRVWEALMRIPYGETRTYMAQAAAIGKHKACRAVANANGANQLALIIPCHRVIRSNGDLGGYAAGMVRKEWLIEHEKSYLDPQLRRGGGSMVVSENRYQ